MISRYQDRQLGISLIELIMFMVIVSVGLVGILSVMNITSRASADPMLRKQAIAIAESLLEEITLQPFTFCDPDDANAATATNSTIGVAPGNCVSLSEGFGSGAAESRGSTTAPYDNVYDYAGVSNGAPGFAMTGIRAIDDSVTIIPGLGIYNAAVTITQASVGGVPADASLRIDVRVTSGNNVDVTLTGYRLRYAPNVTP